MAKKRSPRRSATSKRRRTLPTTVPPKAGSAVGAPPPPRTIAGSATSRPEASAKVDFAAEYRYVVGDLKRIGVIAAAMLATLIALAIFLP